MPAPDPQRWQQIEDLLHEALALAPALRGAWLARACGDDPVLRREVESLLAGAEAADAMLEKGVGLATAARLAGTPSELPAGVLLGPWRVLRPIGRGGMGEVYLAERADGLFQQQIAIKLLRAEAAEHLERFQAERQILARLEHPGIARLLDGGVHADGRPWMAMEYVPGESLTQYCSARKLDLAARLALFDQVCEAVSFAHANLVVHRDLKPSNIQVTPAGRIKLLDFGVAKLLDPARWPGGTGAETMAPLTPQHAAPEQLLGRPVTTATDVYALGVVLYELLSGRSPWAALRELPMSIALTRMLREDAAPASSAADAVSAGGVPARLLRGDLDAILARTLRKEPQARYATVAALRADLDALRRGAPVSAGPDSRGYRVGKFMRRHRIALAVAASFLVMLGVFTWQLASERDRALGAEQQARREAAAANQVADYLVSLFRAAGPEQAGGRPIEPRQLVDQGRAQIESRLREQPWLRARLLATLGQVYAELGLVPDAIASLQEALQLQAALPQADSPLRAQALYDLGLAQLRARQFEPAAQSLRESLALRESAQPADAARVADVLLALGIVQEGQSRIQDSIVSLERARDLVVGRHGAASVEAARVRKALGLSYHRAQRWQEARSLLGEALKQLRATLGPDHRESLDALNSLGIVLWEQGEHAQAETQLREAVAKSQILFGSESAIVTEYQSTLSSIVSAQGRVREAVALQRDVIATNRRVSGADGPNLAVSLANLAFDLEDLGEYTEALATVDEALAIVRRNAMQDSADAAYIRNTRARLLIRLQRIGEASAMLQEESDPRAQGNHGEGFRGVRLMLLGDCQRLQGRFDEAAAHYAQALAAYRASQPPGDAIFALMTRRQGLLLAARGAHGAAVAPLREASRELAAKRGANSPRTLETRLELAESLLASGAAAEATAIVREVAPLAERELAAQGEARVRLARLRRQLAAMPTAL